MAKIKRLRMGFGFEVITMVMMGHYGDDAVGEKIDPRG